MIDMRNYRETVKAAVARERQDDENWGWHIKAVTKTCAKIGWGYLDYLGEKDGFVVEVDEDEELGITSVTGTIPNGKKVYRLIDDSSWSDCKTIEDGIASVIHGMALSAHHTY